MYCTKCGNKVSKNDKFCENCGNNLNPQPISNQEPTTPSNDNNKVLFGALGFISPAAGLVLYITNKDTNPEAAKMAGIFALLRIPINIIVWIFYIIFWFIELL